MKLVSTFLAALLALPMATHAEAPPSNRAAAPSLEDFIRKQRFLQVKISPKGTYAAATVPLEDRTVLVILKPGTKEPYGHVTMRENNTHVVDFWWVNDERILFTVGEKAGALEAPVSFGEIWGVNADGGKQGILAGARASTSASRAGGRSRAERSAFFLIDTLHNDDDNVLVGTAPFDAGEAPFTSVQKLNVNSGAKTPVATAPVRGASFLTDQQGRVRFAAGENEYYKSVLYYRPADGSKWQLINDESQSEKAMEPLDFNADDSIAYIQSDELKGPDSVQAFDTRTGTMREASRDDLVDPNGLVYAIGKRYPIGVEYLDGKPRFEYFDPKSADAQLHKALQNSFDGDVVYSSNFTDDGKLALLRTWSDRNPGDYYLFNTETKHAELLISRADWLDRNALARTQPFLMTARDGRQLEGFLTIPNGSDGKNLPLVVYPHGGPFGPYDQWGYEPDLQILASHGYAVLQVNFRGSGNYGKEFEESGWKQWGKSMQDDVTDATRWAINEGVANPNRICLFGSSYGGYASLMGVAKEPTQYRCAAGYVGVYDLKMLWGRGDISESRHGKDFLTYAVGRDNLDTASPTRLAGQIKVPVFLAAGGEDVRAPQAQTEAMERALRTAGVPVETMYVKTEGHGFFTIEHRREFYTKLLAFLDRNIGNGTGGNSAASAGAK